MARHKSFRKEDFINSPIAFKMDSSWKGVWRDWFGNDHPMVLELGCGKGEMAIGLAQLNAGVNYTGIDMKSDRLWVAAKEAESLKLKNIAFHRMDILSISDYYGQAEIDEIWITFCDPFPKEKHEARRLTHSRYLSEYKKILRPGGIIQFKTDNEGLFDWTAEHLKENGIEILKSTRDLHHSELASPETTILTSYEKRFLAMGQAIFYLSFCLDGFKGESKE